jgi:hypothetical protein
MTIVFTTSDLRKMDGYCNTHIEICADISEIKTKFIALHEDLIEIKNELKLTREQLAEHNKTALYHRETVAKHDKWIEGKKTFSLFANVAVILAIVAATQYLSDLRNKLNFVYENSYGVREVLDKRNNNGNTTLP